MDEKRIEEIINEVFEKAKKEHASHSRFALSNYIADVITEKHRYIHPKTLERAYDRYIDKKKKHGPPSAESIDLFCKYLKKTGYKDYLESNPIEEPSEPKEVKWKWLIATSVAFSVILIATWILWDSVFVGDSDATPRKENLNNSKNEKVDGQFSDKQCMTWADSLYVTVSCDTGPFSEYGTDVKPFDSNELQNMKKVEVYAGYPFFADDGSPLIWYYKNKEGEHEYYKAPGLHPVTGETLKKITPYIIQTYVPIHSNN